MWYWPLIISTYTFETYQSYRSIVFNMVSMPYVGLTSFLLYLFRARSTLRSVSMPYVGLTSFLHSASLHIQTYTRTCVNALCRAHIISTLPLQNLSIYAAFRAYFCTYFSELSDYWVQ